MQFHGMYRSPQRMYSSVAGIFFFALLSAMKEKNCGILKDAENGWDLYNQNQTGKEKDRAGNQKEEIGRNSLRSRKRGETAEKAAGRNQ